MRAYSLLVLIVLCLINPVFGAQVQVSALSVVLPPDRSVIESPFVTIAVTTDGTIDSVRLRVNSIDYSPLEKIKRNVCKVIKLVEGINTVTVSGFKENKHIQERKITLFYRSALSQSTAPGSFSRYSFHTSDREKQCIQCHDLGHKATKESRDINQSPCIQCHKKLLDFKFAHGPASVWECTICHSATIKGHKYNVPATDQPVCYSCHSDTATAWNSKKFQHGPASIGNCTICHSPHASDYDFFLRKPTTDLCISCHEEKATGVHVVSGISGGGHPVRGRPDPLHPGKELSCASCHNPHASDFVDLLFRDRNNEAQFCRACHRF
jgi:predicted CXXCH cytochrome family protein